MKRMLFLLWVILPGDLLFAQNIGIGTTTPHASALLDISGTTKGVLFPRMTTSQRFAIAAPSNGLMVYDTDKNEMYHYAGTAWKPILNGEYWTRPITSRSRITNSTDSVGIGTNSPSEWLDVDGNIRSRNNLIADSDVRAAGDVIGGNLVTTGNLLASGTSLLSGSITTNNDFIINNTGATIQLKSSNVNKGFFQIAGDNVRIGTNSGNDNGKFIIRNDGADRIAVEADGKLTTPTTGDGNSLIPLCYGVVSDEGGLLRGTSNVTVEKVGTSGSSTNNTYWRISCTGISATSIINVTPDINYTDQVSARCYLLGTARVYTFNKIHDVSTGLTSITYYHSGFSFVIYK